jgi:HAE1 family hydrophobic/amphiphilic exporter-1
MNIAQFAVNRPVAVIMRIGAFIVFGAVCLTRLPVDLLPKVSIPTVAVITTWPNVSPEVIETQISRPLEEAVSAATNLYLVQSTSIEGQSTIRVQFNWGTDIDAASIEVMQLVQRAQHSFPNDPTLEAPTVFKFDPTQLPILIYGVSGENDSVKLRMLLDNQITPLLESANGVASAVASGGDQRAIVVDVDPVAMQAHGISLTDIENRILAENVNLPAGIAKQGETEYTIRALGWFVSPADMANMPVKVVNGAVVTLGQVAQVRDSHAETRIFNTLNGDPCAGMIISKQSGANTIATTQAVLEKLDRVHQLYPNLQFKVAYDQATFIQQSITDVKTSAVLGGLLAVVILMFFLRNVRSTLVVALSIPTSIISTFSLLYLVGFTLNTMTLGGLALSTGLIVDDAVVVLENIFRHVQRDRKTPREAAVSATQEIMGAVFASTWTVMVVFLPLIFIKGQAGEMFTSFALVVIFALAISLLDATTVVPMLAARLIPEAEMRADEEGVASGAGPLTKAFHLFGKWFNALDHTYRRALQWALHHRLWTLLAAAGITGATFLLVPQIGTELLPPTDSGDFLLDMKLPVPTALDVTHRTMNQINAILDRDPDVETVFTAAGAPMRLTGTATTLIPYEGGSTVRLKDDRKHSTLQNMTSLQKEFNKIPGAQVRLNQYDIVSNLLTGGNTSVEVDIMGPDLATLSALGQDVIARTRNIAGFQSLDVNWQAATPEIQWQVDRAQAAQLGVQFSDIANTIEAATGTAGVNGSSSVPTYYQELGYEYPILIQQPEATRKTVAEMESMPVTGTLSNGEGQTILLGQVAHPVYQIGPSQITRQDRQRYIAVTGQPQGRSSGDIQNDIQKALATLKLPTGYYWDWGVNQKRQAEEFAGMGLAVALAIALIYMLLASQFESFIHPLTILMSVPLAATGVVLALFLTGRSFGLTAFIGVLMLVGIVVKNSILLVDYTNHLRGTGLEREEALLTAGPTRLRPILMTACAAILGMLPLALGLGKGSEMNQPMATAVIGGLMTSTFLTLLVVPTVYSVLDDLATRFRGKERY